MQTSLKYSLEYVSASTQDEMLEYLKKHEDYTLFLLSNFAKCGPKLGKYPFSGNYKLLRLHGNVVAVFYLTKVGTLLIHSSVEKPIYDIVLKACLEEEISIHGLIGEWNFCNNFWQFLKEQKIVKSERLASKEILFSLDLDNTQFASQPNVRVLTQEDYQQWKPLRLDFHQEEGIPNPLSDNEMQTIYYGKVKQKIVWGYFLDDKLVSIADLNANVSDLGQVGGVYTAPNYRKKGYSKAVMQQLILDVKKQQMRKLVIFTGEKNLPAQHLYMALGSKHVGYYALLFCN